MKFFAKLLLLLCVVVPVTVSAQTVSPPTQESLEYLKSLSLEALLETEVVTVSRRPEQAGRSAAAVYVVSARDLERSGARSIPDALRMVPGLQVARINNNQWVVSSRGFGDLFSDKLQVMVDGRSIYTPLFSGVFWEVEDLLIEDVERIEVIRGVGASMWGPNSVNGVINIITKSAEESQGTLLTTTVGSGGGIEIGARQGGTLAQGSYLKGSVKVSKQPGTILENGDEAYDGVEKIIAGFRLDHSFGDKAAPASSLMVKADVRKVEEETNVFLPGLIEGQMDRVEIPFKQSSLLGRLTKDWGKLGETRLQSSIVYSEIDTELPNEKRWTADVDLQQSVQPDEHQDWLMGTALRYSHDEIVNSSLLSFDPESDNTSLFSLFLQDDIGLVKDLWYLTLGARLDYYTDFGYELQPTIRIRYLGGQNQTIWGAVSRGVRSPSRIDTGLVLQSSEQEVMPGYRVRNTIYGSNDFDTESVIAWEAGYRKGLGRNLRFDSVFFYNDYQGLRSIDPMESVVSVDSSGVLIQQDLSFGNNLDGKSYGMEVFTSWKPLPVWELSLTYSFLRVQLEGGEQVVSQQFEDDDFPVHQAGLRSWLDLGENWEVDSELYWVDDLAGHDVDGYLRLDLRFGWKITDKWKLSILGENLIGERHAEFASTNGVVATEVPRQFFVKLTWAI